MLLALCFKATIRGDGIGYYSYLPALVGHQTYDMGPTFERFINAGIAGDATNLEHHLPNGLTANYKPVGSALLALPFYGLTHLVRLILPGPRDATLGREYQLAFTLASLFYVIVALLLTYRLLRDLFGGWSSALAVAAVALATPLAAYSLFEPSYYHSFAVFAITAFALLMYRTHGRRRIWQWFAAGILWGLATIVHVNEVLFLALVPIEAAWLVASRRWSANQLAGYAAFAGGAGLAALPQLVTDQVMFGQWLPVAAPFIKFDFRHLHLLEVLVSTHNGWLPWSPIVVIAILGVPMAVRRLGWLAAALIAVGVGEVILNAALSDWFGGLAFGARRLTDLSLPLAISLGAVFAWLSVRLRAWAPAVLMTGGFIAWNAMLLAQFYYVLPPGATPSWSDFLSNQLRALPYVPHLFIQGTVVRNLGAGDWDVALGVWLALAIAAASAAWVATRSGWALPGVQAAPLVQVD